MLTAHHERPRSPQYVSTHVRCPIRQAVSELTGLVGEANSLLATSTRLETKYLALPSYAERRNSMQLLEDTQVYPVPDTCPREGRSDRNALQMLACAGLSAFSDRMLMSIPFATTEVTACMVIDSMHF